MKNLAKALILVSAILFVFGCTCAHVRDESGQAKKAGCTAKNKSGAPKWQIREGVSTFRELAEVDIDGDSVKEIVALYTTSDATQTGVKVVKIEGDRAVIVYTQNFDSLDVKFKKDSRLPVILVESKSCAGKETRIYDWDGRRYILRE